MPRRRPTRSATALSVSLPAPIGGWNARDALAAMPATDAVDLVNWFPKPDRIVVRGGFSSYASSATLTHVDSLMEWSGPTGAKFFAVGGAGKIFDISSTTTTASAVVTGLTGTTMSHAMMTTPGGAFLCWVNGADTPQKFDGTNWTTLSITGVTSSLLIGLAVHKARLFLVEKASLRVWYLPRNAVGGAAASLDFGSLCKKGGYMMAMSTWTMDAGEGGVDDYAVFLTSEGECLIYQGSDPSSASSWQLVGIFQVAKPIGRRCLFRYGSDLCMILQDGFYQASQLLQPNVSAPALALSDKIRNAFADAAVQYGTNFGWEALYYPAGQRVIVNVPTAATTSVQYVMNSISRAWCQFQGMNASCWGLYAGKLYFGTPTGAVNLADTGSTDAGSAIAVNLRQAYTDFGAAGRVKRFTLCRPRFATSGTVNVNLSIDVDYQNAYQSGAGTTVSSGGAAWNTSPWNTTPWQIGERIVSDWHTTGTVGTVGSIKVTANVSNGLSFLSADYVAEPGGVL